MSNTNKITIELDDGRRATLELPNLPNLAEFVLSGNWRDFGEFLTFYDPTTDTGAQFSHATAGWTLWQPVGRDDFFRMCAIAKQHAGQVAALTESIRQKYEAQARDLADAARKRAN